MEERVAGQHPVAVGEEPAVDLPLLLVGGVQLGPRVHASSGGPEPGDPQLRAVRVGQRLEAVELVDVVPGHDDRDLEGPEPGLGQVVHRPPRRGVGAHAPDGVVGGGVQAVEADLDVEVVELGEATGRGTVDEGAVGRELDADAAVDRVLDQREEVPPDHRLAAADVDVEDLQAVELVEHGLGLVRGQLVGVAPARRREAVHAGQVAGVGQLPREADGRVEPALELLNQRGRGHAPPPRTRAMPARRRRRPSGSAPHRRPPASDRRDGSEPNRCTTATTSGCFRKIRRRLP